MGGRIDCYLDISSIYSYIAFVDLLRNLDALAAHGVVVEFHPVFLGAIMQSSGNRPPWMVPAKGAYLARDTARATAAVGITGWAAPADLMPLARTTSALRALLAVRARHGPAALRAALLALFRRFWAPPHEPLADDAVLAAALATAVAAADDSSGSGNSNSGARLFDDAEVRRLLDARDVHADELRAETARALELGAFGAPWLWVTDGRAEPFFGSDRLAHIYQHLGLPHHDVRLLPPGTKL